MRVFENKTQLLIRLLNVGDQVWFNGELSVVASTYNSYFLQFVNQRNSYPFNYLGIQDKYAWCSQIGTIHHDGDFPQMETLQDLSNVIIKLYDALSCIPSSQEGTKIEMSASLTRFISDNTSKSKVCDLIVINWGKLNGNTINYLSDREGDMLSYMPKGKVQQFGPDGMWIEKGRQKGKPGRIIRQIFTPTMLTEVTDKDFEIFANLYKAANDKKGTFKIVKGEDIRTWYHHRHYAPDQGSLTNSCMRHDECIPYFDIYTKNPEIVSLLILVNENNLLLGRAILWHTPDNLIMDRVYGTEATIERFRMWATENKYLYRQYNNTSEPTKFVDYLGNTITKAIEIRLPHLEFDKYPYFDTFYMMNDSKTFITNNEGSRQRYAMRNTGGRLDDTEEEDEDYDDEDMVYCEITGDRYHIDECHYIDEAGGYVHQDYTSYCHHQNTSILDRNSFECAWNGETYHTDYMTTVVSGEHVYSEHEDLRHVDGVGWFHCDDVFECEHSNKYYPLDEAVDVVDKDGSSLTVHKDFADLYNN